MDRKSFEIIYKTFVRPILEYEDVIWDNCTQYEKQELDKIQTEAARIATGTTKLVSLTALYKEVYWETLEQRHHNHKLTLFYKMLNIITPLYFFLSSHTVIYLATIFETLMTYKLLMLDLTSTLVHFCHPLSEHGITYLQKKGSMNL